MNVFVSDFAQITRELDADTVKAAENGTGYFDGLVHRDLGLEPGARAKFTDRHGRRGVVLATQLGNVVIFQRYIDDERTLVHNEPTELSNIVVRTGAMSTEEFGILNGMGKVNAIEQGLRKIRGA
jgi:hypothetical protein